MRGVIAGLSKVGTFTTSRASPDQSAIKFDDTGAGALCISRLQLGNGEIGTPAPVRGSDWGCRIRIRGLSEPVDTTIFGIDSIQALELALAYSGMSLTSSREFLSGRLRLWNHPAKDVFDVVLPLPLSSLKSALETISRGLARLERGRNVPVEWMAAVRANLRSVATELRRRRA